MKFHRDLAVKAETLVRTAFSKPFDLCENLATFAVKSRAFDSACAAGQVSRYFISIRRLMFTVARVSNWLTVLVSLFLPLKSAYTS